MASKRQTAKPRAAPLGAPSAARKGGERDLGDLLKLCEAIPEALIVFNSAGIIKVANASAIALFGYTRKGMSSRRLESLLAAADRTRAAGLLMQGIPAPARRKDGHEIETIALRKDGSEFPAKMRLAERHPPESKLRLCTISDLTQSSQSQRSLHELRRAAESTLEAMPASVAVLDESGLIIGTNQAWMEFARANAAVLDGVTEGVNYLAVCEAAIGDGKDDAARFASGIRAVLRGEQSRFSMEYACHSPDQQRWYTGYATAFKGDGPARVMVAHVDVSERKRAEMVIRRLNAELELRVEQRTAELKAINQQLQQEITLRRELEREVLEISVLEQERISQDLHEDLGQQLAGILCLGGVLEVSLNAQKLAQTKDAAKIIGLVRDALELTRTLARCLHPVAVEAGGLVAALQALSKRTSQVYKVQCDCFCPPELDLDIKTAAQLYRIAQEALANAIQHSKATSIEIHLSSNPHQTLLSVKDYGQGIPIPHPEGYGMGLRIMKYRAELMGGTLEILHEDPGDGTTVICKIPKPAPAED